MFIFNNRRTAVHPRNTCCRWSSNSFHTRSAIRIAVTFWAGSQNQHPFISSLTSIQVSRTNWAGLVDFLIMQYKFPIFWELRWLCTVVTRQLSLYFSRKDKLSDLWLPVMFQSPEIETETKIMNFRFTETEMEIICKWETKQKRKLKMWKRTRNKSDNYFQTEVVKNVLKTYVHIPVVLKSLPALSSRYLGLGCRVFWKTCIPRLALYLITLAGFWSVNYNYV